MKTKTFYYLVSVLLFTLAFYQQSVGLNFSLLAIMLCAMVSFRENRHYTKLNTALIGCILSALAYAYFGDFTSFIVLFISLHWIAMLMFDPHQKLIKLLILAPFNYLMLLPNLVTTKVNISKSDSNKVLRQIVAYAIIPITITSLFAIAYIASSDLASDFFKDYSLNLDINFMLLFLVLFLGSIWMYVLWYFKLPQNLQIVSSRLSDSYTSTEFTESSQFDMYRKSAEITFILLNLTILIFIVIYGIENFTITEKVNSVSANVHKRVYAVIVSIIMAISLILYFFRNKFNFDKQNRNLKRLTYIWIGLNAILVLIAFTKNLEYVYMLGLTHKRIGVFIFLTLSAIGLYLTYKKIDLKRTNWYLLNRMTHIVYITLLVLAVFNWDWIITKFNIETNIPIEQDINYYKYSLHGNDILLYNYFKDTGNQKEMYYILNRWYNKDTDLQLDGTLQPVYTKYMLRME